MEAIRSLRRLQTVYVAVIDSQMSAIGQKAEAVVVEVTDTTAKVRIVPETLPTGLKGDLISLSRKTGYEHGAFTKHWKTKGYVWRYAGIKE